MSNPSEHSFSNLVNPFIGRGTPTLNGYIETRAWTVKRTQRDQDENVENKSSRDLSQQDDPLFDTNMKAASQIIPVPRRAQA